MGGNCFSSNNNQTATMNDPIIPASAKHTGSVIFLHGLGDTGHGWASTFEAIRCSHLKYVFPTAPTSPVTLNQGFPMPSWFDIKALTLDAPEDDDGIKAAAKCVHAWIEDEIKSGIASERILIGGFSQGGGLALYSAITFNKPLAGVVALSSWLPLHRELPGNHEANKRVAILQCHGEQDPLVIPLIGQLTAKNLKEFNPNHVLKTYANMGHSSCPAEMADVKKFIDERLPVI